MSSLRGKSLHQGKASPYVACFDSSSDEIEGMLGLE